MKPLFRIQDTQRIDQIVQALNAEKIHSELENGFAAKRIPLSHEASVEVIKRDQEWKVINQRQEFVIELEDGTLNVFKSKTMLEDWLRKFGSCAEFWFLFGILSVIGSGIADYFMRTHDYFYRSGALLVISGAILGMRKYIRLSRGEVYARETIVDGGHFQETEKERREQKEHHKDIKSQIVGIVFLVLGTLIWAYGELLL